MNARNFGLVMTSLPSDRPFARTKAHNANAPVPSVCLAGHSSEYWSQIIWLILRSGMTKRCFFFLLKWNVSLTYRCKTNEKTSNGRRGEYIHVILLTKLCCFGRYCFPTYIHTYIHTYITYIHTYITLGNCDAARTGWSTSQWCKDCIFC